MASVLLAGTLRAHPQTEELAAKSRRGREAMAAGRFEEAAALYAEITRALPEEPGMLLNLGMALSMADRPRDAIAPLEAALRRRPDLLPASLFLGAAYADVGQPARAVAPLQKVVAAEPDNQEARRRLADALWSLERFEAAVEQYRALAERASDDPRAWYGLGRSYEGLARLARERLQRHAPESYHVLLLVAQLMADEGRSADAFRLYREALAKRPDLAEPHEAIARIYDETGHADWAAVESERLRGLPAAECRTPSLECDFGAGRFQSVLTAALRMETPEGPYWTSRAARELAREAFSRLERLPPSPEASLRRVELLRRRKRTPAGQVLDELKKAAESWPADLRIRRELATVLLLSGDAEGARPLLERLMAREPESAELSLLLGETWLKLSQPRRAVAALERAVKSDRTLLAAHAALGRAYLEAGDSGAAIAPLEAALGTDKDGSLHFQLARAYRATGQIEKASAALARFQELRKAADAEAESLREEFRITPP